MNPGVSVITTVYNGEAYLRTAIESALEQTYRDLEVCVVLDGCDDESIGIVKELAAADSRVKWHEFPRIGRGAALRIAIDRSAGGLVAIMDADDYAFPDKLATMAAAFEHAAPDIAVIGSQCVFFTDDQYPPVRPVDAGSGIVDVTTLLRRTNPLMHSSVVIRRAALDDVGGYDWRRTTQLDYDLFVRLAIKGYRLMRVSTAATAIREHPGRFFLAGPQARYRVASLGVQNRALRGIDGPFVDRALIPARAVALGVPQKHLDRLGRVWVR